MTRKRSRLTDQQIRIRDYRKNGKTTAEIAALMDIEESTVRSNESYIPRQGKPGRPPKGKP